jgi:membrane protease YdiL (CAAX protease family)
MASMEISTSQIRKCSVLLVLFILMRAAAAPILHSLRTALEVSLFLFGIFLVMSVGLVYFGFTKWVKVDIRTWWKTKHGIGGDIAWGLFGTVLLVVIPIATMIIVHVCGWRLPKDVILSSFDWASHPILLQHLEHYFFGFAIAAFTEETIFRGFLQIALTERYGNALGNLLQATLFSLCHIGYIPYKAWPLYIAVFLSGLLFGWLRAKRGTLIVPAIAHGIIG